MLLQLFWVSLASLLEATNSEECSDAYDSCHRWAKSGYCAESGFAEALRAECRHSCGQCRGGSGGGGASDPCTAIRDAAGPGDINKVFHRVLARDDLEPSVLSQDPFVLLLEHFSDRSEATAWAEAASEVLKVKVVAIAVLVRC